MEKSSAVQPKTRSLVGSLALGTGAAAIMLGSWLIFEALRHHPAAVLAQANPAQLPGLAYTLDADQAQNLEQQAQACKLPLGTVGVWHDPGVPDTPVRIQSGSYISPSVMLTSVPQIVALPYPAPYHAGAGTLSVLGTAKGVELALTPVTRFADFSGAVSVNVTWTVGNPCP